MAGGVLRVAADLDPMVTTIGAAQRHSSTRPAATRSRPPSAAAPTASASSDAPATAATFRRTELSIQVDVSSRAVRIDVVDATTKAPVRTIVLGGHGAGTARQSAPLLLDRRV